MRFFAAEGAIVMGRGRVGKEGAKGERG